MSLPDDLARALANLEVINKVVNDGPGNIVSPGGRVHPTLASILGDLATEGNIYPPELNDRLDAIEVDISNLEGEINDLIAPADSAYAAQQSALAAEESDKAARYSVAMTLPDNFLEGSRYWTNQNGETVDIDGAAGMPLPGTFETITGRGRVYKTEASPTDDNSFATLGVVRGIAGKRIIIEADVDAVTYNTNSAEHSYIGVGVVALDENFNLIDYSVSDQSYDMLEPTDGRVKLNFDFQIPDTPAPWYRPRLYYNYNGAGPTQGNQQFRITYLHTEQILPTEFAFQPASEALTQISNASPVNGDILQRVGGVWVAQSATDFLNAVIATGDLAPTESPDFTGTPLSVNPDPDSNSRMIATTSWVVGRINALKGSPPTNLDTLQELAAAVGNNPDFATVMGGAIDNLQDQIDALDPGGGGAAPIPQITHYTSGSGTYTVPTGTKYLKVTMRGGGGGGSGSGTTPADDAVNGGDTTFDIYTAGGGSKAVGTTGGAGGTASGGSGGVRRSGAAGMNAAGGYQFHPGGKGGGPYGTQAYGSQNGPHAPANSGSGGGGGGCDSAAAPGGGGGEGAFISVVITSPGASYSYAVGTAGAGGTAGTSGFNGGNGGSGEIIIEAYV